MKVLEEFAGVLPFDDKASPQVIKREFGLSKNAFKRAVGGLLKSRKDRNKGRTYLYKEERTGEITWDLHIFMCIQSTAF